MLTVTNVFCALLFFTSFFDVRRFITRQEPLPHPQVGADKAL